MNKLLATAALAGSGALLAATHATHSPTAPAGNVGLLRRYDLSALLRTLPAGEGSTQSVEPMNGFFGPDRYRIELVNTQVRRDPQQPNQYQVWGKDRFKGRVTPFAGTITFTDARQTAAKSENWPALYAATGTYELREEASRPGAGTFKGRITLEYQLENGQPGLPYYYQKGPSKGGTILYNGTWTSAAGPAKPAVWVANIWTYLGPEVFNDLIVGERSQHFNAKYAKLGWNSYWQNDEWWASGGATVAKRK